MSKQISPDFSLPADVVEGLTSVLSKLENRNVVSKTDATKIVDLSTELGEYLPHVNSYTEQPSYTNLEVTIEALSKYVGTKMEYTLDVLADDAIVSHAMIESLRDIKIPITVYNVDTINNLPYNELVIIDNIDLVITTPEEFISYMNSHAYFEYASVWNSIPKDEVAITLVGTQVKLIDIIHNHRDIMDTILLLSDK